MLRQRSKLVSDWLPAESTRSRLRGIPNSGWVTGSRLEVLPLCPTAETARQRLVAGGLADAYLMQDGAEPMISLGVFRDRSRADRVASAARTLGFMVTMRDRYRPAVEQWLLIRPRPDQAPEMADLSLAGDRIMRTESAPCDAAGNSPPQIAGPAAPGGSTLDPIMCPMSALPWAGQAIWAGIAQWQSNRFVSGRLGVQVPLPA